MSGTSEDEGLRVDDEGKMDLPARREVVEGTR